MITDLIQKMNNPIRLCILGAPGSGKGTISSLLVNMLPDYIHHYNVGGILREQAKNGDSHILQVHSAGGLVDSDKVLAIFDEALGKDSFILDGSPRKPNEAEFILQHPKWKERPGYLIHLDLPLDLARERLLSRGRFDDQPEVVEQRFAAFFDQTTKSIELFGDKCIRVNAGQAPVTVVSDILTELIKRVKE